MPEEPNGWLRELLEGMRKDIQHVRDKVDGFDARITRLETHQQQQARVRTGARLNAPHWLLVGVAAASLVWSVLWATLH